MSLVCGPSFEDFLGAPPSSVVGESEGLAFLGKRMYVVSKGSPSQISVFDARGLLQKRFAIDAHAVGMCVYQNELLVAHDKTSKLTLVNPVDQSSRDFIRSDARLGALNCPIVDRHGHVYVSNREDQCVYRIDAQTRLPQLLLRDAISNPNALLFGPENNCLYVGGQGGVLRVHLSEEGKVSKVDTFVRIEEANAEQTFEVDGLCWDHTGKLWIGCPNEQKLFVAGPCAASPCGPSPCGDEMKIERRFDFDSSASEISASCESGEKVFWSKFVNLQFAPASFAPTDHEQWIYYTNLDGRTVGRFEPGLIERSAKDPDES